MTPPALTRAEMDVIRERCEKATPGPWAAVTPKGVAAVRADGKYVWYNARSSPTEYSDETVANWQRDAEFTAHARSDIPALLAEVERLRKREQWFAVRVDEYADHHIGCPARCTNNGCTCGYDAVLILAAQAKAELSASPSPIEGPK